MSKIILYLICVNTNVHWFLLPLVQIHICKFTSPIIIHYKFTISFLFNNKIVYNYLSNKSLQELTSLNIFVLLHRCSMIKWMPSLAVSIRMDASSKMSGTGVWEWSLNLNFDRRLTNPTFVCM